VVRQACRGSLVRRGARKVHWECWSACNLSCRFCYRTTGTPLATPEAERLLATVATAGAETIVFAGGDPSLRRDIGPLLGFARTLGLRTEVHTNAQHASASFREALTGAGCVGLSLDGPTSELHDGFRDKPGNFARVLDLLGFLDRAGVPVIVRTLVAQPNHHRVAEIGGLLTRFRNVVFWYLLEFSPVNTGFRNRQRYAIHCDQFEDAVDQATTRIAGQVKVVARRREDKDNAYVMLTPSGDVYGTTALDASGAYPLVGSILRDHLSDLAGAVGFERRPHEERYRYVDRVLEQQREALVRTLPPP
jgi:pyruvate-formate lyase-activating enzyme